MATGEFATALVRFKVTGEGALEIEYEVGVETPEDRFRHLFAGYRNGDISNLHMNTLRELYLNSTDDTWHLEVTEGPGREICNKGVRESEGTSDPQILDTSDLQVEVTGARGEQGGECPVCQGDGQGIVGDEWVLCLACGGTGQETAILSPALSEDEIPGF